MRIVRRTVPAAVAFAVHLMADPGGADPGLSGGPGEQTCVGCHSGTALNAGGGSVRITLPGERTYVPGVSQRFRVQIADPSQRRWGFTLSARSGLAQAGDLTATDGFVQVICANGRPKPCANPQSIQYATHTLTGTRNGTAGGVTFEADWTPPASAAGKITLYAAANAANGDNRTTGDRIYATTVELEAAPPPRPAISATRGVVNAASFEPGIAPGGWVTIAGTNLSNITRVWTQADFVNGRPPESLDGVRVTINNRAAMVQYVSPTQINAIAPDDTARGPVEVRVDNNGQSSDAATAILQGFSPAFFAINGRFLTAAAVKPGEFATLYGTGFGATGGTGRIPTAVTVRIGGVPAAVTFAGLAPGFVQLFQFNVQVPETLADGDHTVVARIDAAESPSSAGCCLLSVKR